MKRKRAEPDTEPFADIPDAVLRVPTTLELILDGFGIKNPSPAQQAIALAMDGEELGLLWEDPDVQSVFGGVRPEAIEPRMVLLVAASRALKSKLAAAKMLRCALTCALDLVALGDEIALTVLGPQLKHARPAMTNLIALAQAKFPDRVDHLLQNSFNLMRDNGVMVEVSKAALDSSGGGVISRWCAGALFTECTRMVGENEGDKNFESSLTNLRNRMLDGAQIIGEGSPWAPWGPVYTLDQNNFGKPTRGLLVMRAPGPVLWPARYTKSYCELIYQTDKRAHQADVLGQYVDPENALFATAQIKACTDEGILERLPILHPETKAPVHQIAWAMDPATRGNVWTLVGIRCIARDKYEQVMLREWQGSPEKPLKPSEVLREVREAIRPFGGGDVMTDQASFDALSDIGEELGHLDIAAGRPDGGVLELMGLFGALDSKDQDCEALLLAISEQRLRLLDQTQQRVDLQRVKKRITTNDAVFQYVESGDGRHCDTVPALGKCLRFPPDPPGTAGFRFDGPPPSRPQSGSARDLARRF